MKVYIVMRGCYSDKFVDRVFLKEEDAMRYVEILQKGVDECARYFERETSELSVPEKGRRMIPCILAAPSVIRTVKGNYALGYISTIYDDEAIELIPEPLPEPRVDIRYGGTDSAFFVYVPVEALGHGSNTNEIFEKIVQDKFAEYMAKQEGIV